MLTRLKQYNDAVLAYTSVLNDSKQETILIPGLIFRGYSQAMNSSLIGALNDLITAKDFNNFYYNQTINILIDKIKEIILWKY